MSLIEKSLRIALEAHEGQKDKAGMPYVLHPIRLMQKMDDELEMSAALLHDVLEDSQLTAEHLREKGIPEEVVTTVICLTRKEHEAYEVFIERVSTNDMATRVKRADLEDNINILRLKEVKDRDLQRLRKYHSAWNRLSRR